MSVAINAVASLEPTPSPLRFGERKAFEQLRAAVLDSGFTEKEICRRLDIESLDRFRAIRDGRPETAPVDAVDALIRLFLDNEPVAWSEATALLPPNAVEIMRDLGLLRPNRGDPTRAVANVLMYPTESLILVSDVVNVPDGERAAWWDIVYAAITTNTRTFMSAMPRSRCEAFLDLCAGTGIAALAAASSFADHAWAVNVADRSTQFAEFNARLNGISNVTTATGDLYEPVAGLTFDRIVAHPPYVPSRETRLAYRDGGTDGEEVTRRVIAGLPDHLRPGGHFHCAVTATDRREAPLEQRLRTMLGPAADEFDIAVVVRNEFDPTEYQVRLAIAGRSTWKEAEEWHNHFAPLGIVKMVYATIAIVRHRRPHGPFTVRRQVGTATGALELQRLASAAEVSASVEAFEQLLESRPFIPAHVSLQTKHTRDSEGWVMTSSALETGVPFNVRLPCPPAMVPLVGRMDGTQTVRELYAKVSAAQALESDASIERLASYIHILAAHGLIELHSPVTT